MSVYRNMPLLCGGISIYGDIHPVHFRGISHVLDINKKGLGGFFLNTILYSPPMNIILYIVILEEVSKCRFS